MISYWEKYSIQRNVLIAIFIFCLAYAAHCQTKKKGTKSYTLLEDNPIYVQDFVSRMMSKYPLPISDNTLRDFTGMELDANLGYEPYWKDSPDMTWEEKCARCPELFKNYTSVCAIDSMEVVTVNISMCDLLRQNCLAGIVHGHSSGIQGDYQGHYYVVADGWARVSIKQNDNAVIQLSTLASNTAGDRYMIVIDGWGGKWSAIYKNDQVVQWYENDKYKALWDNHYVEFVMRWNASTGWLLITESVFTDWRHGFHLNITDPNPFPIKYIAVGSTQGDQGDWIIKDLPTGFMITQLYPCADGAVAHALVTSPTEVSNILSSHTPINKAYFSRIHAVGIDVDFNVSFHTREEY